MCGIAGIISTDSRSTDRDVLERMATQLHHRGPDTHDIWRGESVALVHTRLSIIDLSLNGHQPMVSFCGRYITTYNGEIYNYRELKKDLDGMGIGIRWRGTSDTEVMLAAISVWGLEKALRKLNGMFAAAVFDTERRILFLVRDRFGEKPLYYGKVASDFVFASELKALHVHPRWAAEVNNEALNAYVRLGYVPAPRSIYKGTDKLRAGHFAKITLRADGGFDDLSIHRYWDMEKVSRQKRMDDIGPTEAVEQVHDRLKNAVSSRMVADVPLGAFLSGGIDSSTIVALMQSLRSDPIKTFTIGFREDKFDETKDAKRVAAHLGTNHTEVYLEAREALDVIPKIPTIYDEPFADHSQIPTILISRLARCDVTVALTGDGGDEVFAGYSRYFWTPELWRRLRSVPMAARRGLGYSLNAIPAAVWDRIFAGSSKFLSKRMQQRLPGEKLHKLARLAACSSPSEMYKRLLSHWSDPSQVLVNSVDEQLELELDTGCGFEQFVDAMMYWDTIGYMPDDILAKVDRASMANSLETRIPMLDHELVEFAWRLPTSFKVRDGSGKWVLTQVLEKYLPKELFDRPKMGFELPLGEWLRGPLREWSETLLDEKQLNQEGIFNAKLIRNLWKEHLARRRDHQYALWNILMYQAWRREYL